MLLPTNQHLLWYSVQQVIAEYRREAEVDQLAGRARPRHPRQRADQIGRVWKRLGHAFAALEGRLKPQPPRGHAHLTFR